MNAHASESDETVRLDLPAAYRYLNVISACLAAVLEHTEGLSDQDTITYNVQLAVQEACTNIVDHAYEGQPGGRIKLNVSVDKTPHRLIVDLYDTGAAFDPSQVPAPNLNDAQVEGYGLFLMRTLMDELTYEHEVDLNHWRLVKNL